MVNAQSVLGCVSSKKSNFHFKSVYQLQETRATRALNARLDMFVHVPFII